MVQGGRVDAPLYQQREVEALVRRFGALPEVLQLEAFSRLRTLLKAAVPEENVDAELEQRASALAAIRKAAALLEKPEGVWPTGKEFDAVSGDLDGWTEKKVRGLFGRWTFAIDALNGTRRTTLSQRNARRRLGGRASQYEEPMVSVRLWLETDPLCDDYRSYDAWCRRENRNLAAGELRKPLSGAVKSRLGLGWRQVVALARGEELPADDPRRAATRTTWSDGPHELITRNEIAQLASMTRPQVTALTRRADFPPPALVGGRAPAWLRADVDAFLRGRRDGWRPSDWLGDQYLFAKEAARLLRVTPEALRQPGAAAPKPTAAIAGALVWYRPEFERWLEKTPVSPYSGRARITT